MTDEKSIKIGKRQTILLSVLSLSHAFVGTIVELLGYKYMMPSDGSLKMSPAKAFLPGHLLTWVFYQSSMLS